MWLPFLMALTRRPTLLLALVVASGVTLYFLKFETMGALIALVAAIFVVDRCAKADPREVQARLEKLKG
jgi:hypothetical protein